MDKNLTFIHKNLTNGALVKELKKIPPEQQQDYEECILFNNRLDEIPSLLEFAGFTSLRELWLEDNQITDINPTVIPITVKCLSLKNNLISSVPNLSSFYFEELYLGGNSIRRLIGNDIPKTVKVFGISGNVIDSLPLMSRLKNMEKLYLRQNFLKDIDGNDLPPNLKTLFLSGNNINHVEHLFHLDSLQTLTLHKNKIEILFGLPRSLKCLSLAENPLRKMQKVCFLNDAMLEIVRKKSTYDTNERYLNKSLSKTQIDGLEVPPSSIYRQGYNSILNYFDSISKNIKKHS